MTWYFMSNICFHNIRCFFRSIFSFFHVLSKDEIAIYRRQKLIFLRDQKELTEITIVYVEVLN